MSRQSFQCNLGLFLLAIFGMLGFYSLQVCGQAPAAPPFVDAAAQRNEMIQELKEIRGLLKEQNALLRQMVPKSDGKTKAKK